MKGQTNKKLLVHQTQRKLRRNMTDAELRLWRYLKGRQMSGFKFRRQHPFEDYVLDFVCLEAMFIIEVDGAQHAHNTISDRARTKKLREAGFKVVRFWNNEVLEQMEAVKESIWTMLKVQNPAYSNDPSPPRSFRSK
jgi:very-short-patch-repair endonuclease